MLFVHDQLCVGVSFVFGCLLNSSSVFTLCTGGEQGKDGTTVPTLSRTISMPVDIAGKGLLSC